MLLPTCLSGARVTRIYPLVPLGPHHVLAVGAVSLENHFALCAVSDPEADPALGAFGDCLEHAIARLDSTT